MAKFQKGQSGNPSGKPRGCKSKWTAVREAIADELPAILGALRRRALEGDVAAATALLDRCLPKLKPTHGEVEIPGAGKTLAERAEAIAAAALSGELQPDTASDLMNLLASQARIKEVAELEARITALEERHGETT